MTTILVHMDHDEQRTARLAAAVRLAVAHGAHLAAVYTLQPASLPASIVGRGASVAFLREMTESAREHAASVRAEFDEAVRRAGLAAAWREDDGDPLERLAVHSRYADLVVVSRARGVALEDDIAGHRLDHIAMYASCPALIVPEQGSRELTRALVAWKSCREAARALRDAVPFLRRAEQTTLLTIARTDSGHLPGADAAAHLARHGVRVEARADYGDDRDAGDVIERCARDLDADMVVMGAYGRSRLRELVLGGATRHVLTHARIPVLMSH